MALWLSKNLVLAVRDRLAEGPSGPIGLLNLPRMSRALRQAGCPVEDLPLSGESRLAALIVGGIAASDAEALAGYRAHLQPGGQLLSIDKRDPAQVSSLLLCAGLSDLRQSSVSRLLLTCAYLPLR